MRNQGRPAPEAALLQAAREGDEAAFIALVDGWLPAVYDFAARLLGDEGAAAEVAEATFMRALDALPAAPNGENPGPWLFGIAWPVALAGARRGPSRFLPTAFDPGRLPGSLPARPPLPGALAAAAAALEPRQRALLDLHLRQGLDAEGVGRVLNISQAGAKILLERLVAVAEPRLETALLVALGGPARCPGLRGLLAGQPLVSLPSSRRRETEQHAAACPTCTDRLQGLPSALVLFGALSPVSPLPGLAEEIRETVRRGWPLRARPGRPVMPASGLTPPPASPRPPSRVPRRFTEFGAGLAAAAAVFALALFVPASPLAVTRDRKEARPAFPAAAATADDTPGGRVFLPGATATPPARTVAAVSPTATASATAAGGAIATPVPTRPAPSPTATAIATAVPPSPTPSPQPTPAATSTPVATATPGSTATATPCAAGVYTNTNEVTIPASGVSFFLVFNQSFCAPVDFAVQVTEGSAWLQAGPAGGTATIPSGGSARVDLVASTSAPGSHSGKVRVSGGGTTVIVSVAYAR